MDHDLWFWLWFAHPAHDQVDSEGNKTYYHDTETNKDEPDAFVRVVVFFLRHIFFNEFLHLDSDNLSDDLDVWLPWLNWSLRLWFR